MSSAPRVLVRRQEQNFGPYSLEQINSMLLRGEVDQDNLAWVEGAPDWQPVRTLPGIRQLPPIAPRPAPRRVTRTRDESDCLILPAFLLAFFLGPFGAHRFYTGRTGSAIVMLLFTISIVGIFVSAIWSTIDWILLVCGAFRDSQQRLITRWT